MISASVSLEGRESARWAAVASTAPPPGWLVVVRRVRRGSQSDWRAAMALAWQASEPWVKQISRLRQNSDLWAGAPRHTRLDISHKKLSARRLSAHQYHVHMDPGGKHF